MLSAQQLAEQSSHAQVEPEHLLVTLVEQREGIVPEVLRKMNADPVAIACEARDLLSKIPKAYGGAQPSFSPRLRVVSELAESEAARLTARDPVAEACANTGNGLPATKRNSMIQARHARQPMASW